MRGFKYGSEAVGTKPTNADQLVFLKHNYLPGLQSMIEGKKKKNWVQETATDVIRYKEM